MHMSMVWLSSAQMESHGESSLVYSHIQQTIQRSKYKQFLIIIAAHCYCRVLLASLCNMDTCPCPCCKVKKSQIFELGMKRDDTCRVCDEWVDDACYWHWVQSAWQYIFQDGKGVKSTAVEDILSQDSSVPIMVSSAFSSNCCGLLKSG